MTAHKLPSMEYTFEIAIQGNESKLNWTGSFKYRRPTIAERGMIEAMRARLNGDLRTIDSTVDLLHEALSHLRFTLKDFPDWWKDADMGGALYDTNVVLEIYGKCLDFEKEWQKKVTGGEPSAVEAGRENETTKESTPNIEGAGTQP